MNTFDWQHFLMRWSHELLESMGEERNQLPPEVIRSGWFGYPSATEEQIACAEARLEITQDLRTQPVLQRGNGAFSLSNNAQNNEISFQCVSPITLPSSYREFLKVTNGWGPTTPFIYKLWSTEELQWFSVRRQGWVDAFVEQYANDYAPLQEPKIHTPSIPDEEYLVYGEAQYCSTLRVEYLQTALEISDKGDSAIYLLNPQVITEDGEWEAWFFGDWLPGADRYRSFGEMMQAEYENFLELRET